MPRTNAKGTPMLPVQERQGPASERTAYNPHGRNPVTGRKYIVEFDEDTTAWLEASKARLGTTINELVTSMVRETIARVEAGR